MFETWHDDFQKIREDYVNSLQEAADARLNDWFAENKEIASVCVGWRDEYNDEGGSDLHTYVHFSDGEDDSLDGDELHDFYTWLDDVYDTDEEHVFMNPFFEESQNDGN